LVVPDDDEPFGAPPPAPPPFGGGVPFLGANNFDNTSAIPPVFLAGVGCVLVGLCAEALFAVNKKYKPIPTPTTTALIATILPVLFGVVGFFGISAILTCFFN
jgi:hypothetical protein